jgi:hypothetical protein
LTHATTKKIPHNFTVAASMCAISRQVLTLTHHSHDFPSSLDTEMNICHRLAHLERVVRPGTHISNETKLQGMTTDDVFPAGRDKHVLVVQYKTEE